MCAMLRSVLVVLNRNRPGLTMLFVGGVAGRKGTFEFKECQSYNLELLTIILYLIRYLISKTFIHLLNDQRIIHLYNNECAIRLCRIHRVTCLRTPKSRIFVESLIVVITLVYMPFELSDIYLMLCLTKSA